MDTSMVRGECDPRFSAVVDLLADSVTSGREVGGGFAVFENGAAVVDLISARTTRAVRPSVRNRWR